MNLYHLKYFYDAARLGSISQAAKVNLVGQPAVSKSIKSLEDTLEVTLTDHKHNRFALTEHGQKVFHHASEILTQVEDLKSDLQDEASLSGEVKFSCQSSMAEGPFLSRAIQKIKEDHPKLSPVLSLGRTDIVRAWLSEGVIDFAIVINNRNFSSFNSSVIYEGKFHLVKSPQYRKDWKKDGIFITEKTKETTELSKKYREKESTDLVAQMRIGSWSVIKSFCLQGLGVGFLPDYMLKDNLEDKSLIKVAPNSYSVPFQVLLLHSKNQILSKKASVIMQYFVS